MEKRIFFLTRLFGPLFIFVFFCGHFVFADIIVFKDGTKIEVNQVWQDGDQVKTELYGGMVTYPVSKVEKIIKGDAVDGDGQKAEQDKAQALTEKHRICNIPEFIKVREFNTKIVESTKDYVYVTWSTEIYTEKAGKVLIAVEFYDQGKNEVDNDLKEVTLSLGDNLVTDITMVRSDVYRQVDTTGLTIKE